MNSHRTHDFKLDPAWIDRIFERLTEIWQQDFLINHPNLEESKRFWGVALYNLSSDEIKHAIEICHFLKTRRAQPPHALEFFDYAKHLHAEDRIGVDQKHEEVKAKSTNFGDGKKFNWMD